MRDFCKSREASKVWNLSGYKSLIELKNAVGECAEFHDKYCRIKETENQYVQSKGKVLKCSFMY